MELLQAIIITLSVLLSVVFGYAATIIPRAYTYYISTLLFALFGLKMLRDGYYMSPTEAQEELEEVQSDLRKRDDEVNKFFNLFLNLLDAAYFTHEY